MKYILNNDNLEVIGKQYLQGVGNYDGTSIGSATDLATVINNNKYTLPNATNSELGGINAVQSFIGTAIVVDDRNNIYLDDGDGFVKSNVGEFYGIKTVLEHGRSFNKAFVHIPYATMSNPGIVNIGSGIGSDNNGKIQLGKDVEWVNIGSVTNMNDFTDSGIYNIFGEHTRADDNLPINNTGGGHTFDGRLTVFDSSLPNIGNDIKDCCLTQLLTLSNRVGGDGNMYIRNGSGLNKESLSWSNWGKLQTNVEVGVIHSGELDNYIDNGMYSGAAILAGTSSSLPDLKYNGGYYRYNKQALIGLDYSGSQYKDVYYYYTGNGNGIITIDNYNNVTWCEDLSQSPVNSNLLIESNPINITNNVVFLSNAIEGSGASGANINIVTFVLITVNNYAIAGANRVSPNCTQLIYGVDINGTVIIKKRIGTKNTSTNIWSFDEWDNVSNTNKIHETSNSKSIKPNKFYIWDEVTSLTITLEPEIPEVINEYMFQFTSGSTPTTLSLPSDIKWVNDELPIIESNYIYQISILNGLGSIMKFKL